MVDRNGGGVLDKENLPSRGGHAVRGIARSAVMFRASSTKNRGQGIARNSHIVYFSCPSAVSVGDESSLSIATQRVLWGDVVACFMASRVTSLLKGAASVLITDEVWFGHILIEKV